jgi:aminoglycoside phosphotransferase (APT) family kinase protein
VVTTPRPLLESVVRSVCGREVEHAVRLTSGGLNETYRVDLAGAGAVVVRIARRPEPWFTEEGHLMEQARAVGVPAPAELGVEHVPHEGGLLSFSIQSLLPGRPLGELAAELPASAVERLVMDSGELLARVHSVAPGLGISHHPRPPAAGYVARVTRLVHRAFGPAAATAVERGADLLRQEVGSRPPPRLALAHGDWMPDHLLVDGGAIVGVIDWEFAGPASPAFDLARWEVSVAPRAHHGSELLRRGYARVADPDAAAEGWAAAFAIGWALEVLGWKRPAPLAMRRRCVEVIGRYAGSAA